MKELTIALFTVFVASAAAKADSVGKASYYALKGRTANGEHVGAYTCAHRTLPFGSQVRVTNLGNNRSVVLRVNDRGPFTGGRLMDVSATAADSLGMRGAGVARVKLEVLSSR